MGGIRGEAVGGMVAARRRATAPAARVGSVLLAGVLLAGCAEAGGHGVAGSPPAEPTAERSLAPPARPTVGLDSARMALALEQAASLPRLRTLVVGRHGEIEVERRFRGPSLETPANVKSVSKSVLSAVVGIAIADGHLGGADQPVAPFFSRYLAGDSDPRKRQITIGHLLSMQSGLERTSGASYGRWVASRDWVGFVMSRPMAGEPGRTRSYSTGNSHLLSAVLTQATGRSTWAYARERLAEPLGISLPRWPADPQGIFFGGNEMRMTPRAMFRFGEMYRNGGRIDGRQVVPEDWVRLSLQPHAVSERNGRPYGYGWFLDEVQGHPMFYAWGYGGQFIFVVPDLELTVVTTSDPDAPREGTHLRAVRELLRDWIVPAALAGASPGGFSEPQAF
jgi:CubicO group peptidase (beta-lactamase class C family)